MALKKRTGERTGHLNFNSNLKKPKRKDTIARIKNPNTSHDYILYICYAGIYGGSSGCEAINAENQSTGRFVKFSEGP